jgi:ribosomal-protein-alanine acetyltransferase
MTLSDPDNILAGVFADLEAGKANGGSTPVTESKSSVRNEYSVRGASLVDSIMLKSIEREGFPGMTPVTKIERDLARENGLYLAAVRAWRPDERALGPRCAIATQSEKEDDSLTARVRRNIDRYLLDYVSRRKLPSDYITGFVGLWFVLDEAHIVIIGIRESDRREGIGEQLLISALEQAVENNSRVMTLEVRESNGPAIELYTKYGFQRVGLRRRYYSNKLVEQHAEKWGWVSRPGYAGPEIPESDDDETEESPEGAESSTDSETDESNLKSPDDS